jgi:hypothetical protein
MIIKTAYMRAVNAHIKAEGKTFADKEVQDNIVGKLVGEELFLFSPTEDREGWEKDSLSTSETLYYCMVGTAHEWAFLPSFEGKVISLNGELVKVMSDPHYQVKAWSYYLQPVAPLTDHGWNTMPDISYRA